MTGAQRRNARMDEIFEQALGPMVEVERRGPYQGVPQYGITGCAESTPSRAVAVKWAALENAVRKSRRAVRS